MQVSDVEQKIDLLPWEEDSINDDVGPLFRLLFDEILSNESSELKINKVKAHGSLYQNTTDLGSVEHFLIFNHLPYKASGPRRIREYQIDI